MEGNKYRVLIVLYRIVIFPGGLQCWRENVKQYFCGDLQHPGSWRARPAAGWWRCCQSPAPVWAATRWWRWFFCQPREQSWLSSRRGWRCAEPSASFPQTPGGQFKTDISNYLWAELHLSGGFCPPPTCVIASIRLPTTLSWSSVRMRFRVARLSLSFRSIKKPVSFSSGDGGALWSSKFSTGMLGSKISFRNYRNGKKHLPIQQFLIYVKCCFKVKPFLSVIAL